MIRRLQHAVAEAYEAGYLGTDILGSGLRPGHRRARRRRRLHLRRGDGAAGLAGGLPRPAPAQAAVPRGGGPVRLPRRWSTTSSRSPPCRTSCCNGADGVRGDRHGEVQGLRDLLAVRARHHARASTRPRSAPRCASCSDLAGGIRAGHRLKFWTPGRLVHAAVHRRAPGRAAGLRVGGRGRARCSAPGRCSCSTRPPAWSGRCCGGSSSTSTSRAASARPAGRAATGWCRSCERLEHGEGTEADLDKLLDICDNIIGRAFCALGDGAIEPRSSRRSSTSGTSTSST